MKDSLNKGQQIIYAQSKGYEVFSTSPEIATPHFYWYHNETAMASDLFEYFFEAWDDAIEQVFKE